MNPQQDIITTLREQLSEARKTANELTDAKVRLERELATRVRLDDPAVSGLVEALERASGSLSEAILVLGGCGVVHPGGQSIYIQSERALAAYNARLKEITQ